GWRRDRGGNGWPYVHAPTPPRRDDGRALTRSYARHLGRPGPLRRPLEPQPSPRPRPRRGGKGARGARAPRGRAWSTAGYEPAGDRAGDQQRPPRRRGRARARPRRGLGGRRPRLRGRRGRRERLQAEAALGSLAARLGLGAAPRRAPELALGSHERWSHASVARALSRRTGRGRL
ncbi:MAG: hypothetical protein AVDCRST_MAG17-254, partial [uncultured Solirubrobacterales bacterium]